MKSDLLLVLICLKNLNLNVVIKFVFGLGVNMVKSVYIRGCWMDGVDDWFEKINFVIGEMSWDG